MCIGIVTQSKTGTTMFLLMSRLAMDEGSATARRLRHGTTFLVVAPRKECEKLVTVRARATPNHFARTRRFAQSAKRSRAVRLSWDVCGILIDGSGATGLFGRRLSRVACARRDAPVNGGFPGVLPRVHRLTQRMFRRACRCIRL